MVWRCLPPAEAYTASSLRPWGKGAEWQDLCSAVCCCWSPSQLGLGGSPELRWECLLSRLLTINSRTSFEQVFYEFAFPLLQNFHNFLTNSGLRVVSFLILPPLWYHCLRYIICYIKGVLWGKAIRCLSQSRFWMMSSWSLKRGWPIAWTSYLLSLSLLTCGLDWILTCHKGTVVRIRN